MTSSICYNRGSHHGFFLLLSAHTAEPSQRGIIAGDSRTLAGIFFLLLAPYRRSDMRERKGLCPTDRPRPRDSALGTLGCRNSIALAPPAPR